MQPTPQARSKIRRYIPWLVAVAIVVAGVLVVVLTRGSSHTTAGTPPPPVGSTSQRALLAQRVGFGGKVTGGAGGAVVHVTSAADDGAGTLRAAVTGDAPRWVVFDHDMTIHLTRPLPVGSNKTIDGRGRQVEITGPGIEGLDLIGVSNVIIESLTLHDFGDVTKTKKNDKPDAIHLDHARQVWIDHDDLSMAGDKLIAVTSGSSGLTVSWSHFHDQAQVFQVGNQSTAKVDAVQTVTVHHNFFDHTGYRNPVISYGRAHVYNNYFLDWKTYAVRSQRSAQMYLQNNVFAAGQNRKAAIVTPSGNGCNDAKTHCDDSSGDLKAVGNLLLNGAKIIEFDPSAVELPSHDYSYTAEAATQALADRIAAGAGPQR